MINLVIDIAKMVFSFTVGSYIGAKIARREIADLMEEKLTKYKVIPTLKSIQKFLGIEE